MSKRKHCSAQPYLDYIGVSERERKEMNKQQDYVKEKGRELHKYLFYYDHHKRESWAMTIAECEDFIRTIVRDCKPKVSKKRIIEFQNLLLDVSKKETGVILAMARITGWLVEAGFEVEK